MNFIVKGACALSLIALSACSNIAQFNERSALLHSGGPAFDKTDVGNYVAALKTLRSLYSEIGIVRPSTTGGSLEFIVVTDERPVGMTQDDLRAVREGVFAYIDSRCDAYVDAIFWANRTRGGLTGGNNAIAGATGAIVGATGGSATALAVLAAAFGLSGNLFDAYYDSVLYGLEPSGIQSLVNKARAAYRGRKELDETILSEGRLLEQVQNYIRICTPAHIEFLVNESVKSAQIEVIAEGPRTLLNFGGFILRNDGSVTGPDGAVYPPFKTLPENAGFSLGDAGSIIIGGKTVDVSGDWVLPDAPADAGDAGDAGVPAPVASPVPIPAPSPAPVVMFAPAAPVPDGGVVVVAPQPFIRREPVRRSVGSGGFLGVK